MKVLVTVLSYNRLNFLRKTLSKFEKYNGKKDIIIFDNGSEDGSREFIKSKNYESILSDSNVGIFHATREMWLLGHERGYDFILNLQDDFPAIRAVPFDDIDEFFDNNPKAGFVRLNDKTKMVKINSKGEKKIRRKPPRKTNIITNKKIKYGPWKQTGKTQFRLHNYMLGFHPNLIKASLMPLLVGDVEKPRERQIMERFEQSGLKAVQMKRPCFETVYPPRNPVWTH